MSASELPVINGHASYVAASPKSDSDIIIGPARASGDFARRHLRSGEPDWSLEQEIVLREIVQST